MNPTDPRPTPRYENTTMASREIARGFDHDYVGVEHLFLAIIRDPYSVPMQILTSSGVRVSDLERDLLALMDSDSYKGIQGRGN